MKFSDNVWDASRNIIHAIYEHPFNQELMHGTLCEEKFKFYIEQDSLYLQDYARCHAIIAAKAPLNYVRTFLKHAEFTFIAEQELVHHHYTTQFDIKKSHQITPATLSYTSYLLRTCFIEEVAVAIAAILPCFWIYFEVGQYIATYSSKNNKYEKWITTYSSQEFGASVIEAIAIFDECANNASPLVKSKMLEAFYHSTCLEWHFWNDAYHNHIFDDVHNKQPHLNVNFAEYKPSLYCKSL